MFLFSEVNITIHQPIQLQILKNNILKDIIDIRNLKFIIHRNRLHFWSILIKQINKYQFQIMFLIMGQLIVFSHVNMIYNLLYFQKINIIIILFEPPGSSIILIVIIILR